MPPTRPPSLAGLSERTGTSPYLAGAHTLPDPLTRFMANGAMRATTQLSRAQRDALDSPTLSVLEELARLWGARNVEFRGALAFALEHYFLWQASMEHLAEESTWAMHSALAAQAFPPLKEENARREDSILNFQRLAYQGLQLHGNVTPVSVAVQEHLVGLLSPYCGPAALPPERVTSFFSPLFALRNLCFEEVGTTASGELYLSAARTLVAAPYFTQLEDLGAPAADLPLLEAKLEAAIMVAPMGETAEAASSQRDSSPLHMLKAPWLARSNRGAAEADS